MTDPFATLRLDGKVVLVTGATQGLGAAIARRCRALGASVVLTGRNAERGEAIRAELASVASPAPDGADATLAEDDVVFVPAELTDPEAIRAVVATAGERFGRLDGVVSAAGLATRSALEDTSVDLWDELFAINVRAPFVLTQAAAPLLRAAGGGSIVNVITMASHGGEPLLFAYASAKAALVAFTRNMGYTLQPDRIRVNGLNIGWTATEGEHAIRRGQGEPEDWLEAADASRPFGRLLRPEEDIAPIVSHLLSDAASMVTGSVMDWDQTVHGIHGRPEEPR